MHFLFTDETNLTPGPGAKFFVYGGLIVPGDQLAALDAAVAGIRADNGYRPGDELKFDTRARPAHVPFENATRAKDAVIRAALRLGCRFIACVVLHDIAKSKTREQMIEWGANQVIGGFNRFLYENGDMGVCIVDRLPAAAEYRYLTDKFCYGLQFQDDNPITLDRIKLFASSCNNASHASSAVDIVLGAFRYCINDPKNIEAAKTMMGSVVQMLWHVRDGENIQAMERGLVFRPKEVRVVSYRAEYDALLAHINGLIRELDI